VVFGSAVTGGEVYRGSRLTELFEAYLFADYGSGHIVALRQNPGTGLWSGTRLATDASVVDFGRNPYDNETLFCDLGAGTVKRLARSGTTGTPPPQLLSQTGAFSDLAQLAPHPGIVPATPNVDFWSDYAIKRRWFSIPNLADTIGFNADAPWSFPSGMVWIKHFDIETTRGNPATRRKLETRFLVKTPSGAYGLSYRWRADQSDADLVPETGLTETIPSSSPAQTWRYPSRADCLTCHTPAAGHALSFNTRQLSRTVTYGTTSAHQIAALSDAGYFSQPVPNPHTLPAFAPASDTSASLEWRARSYFAVNCVQCHQPGGASQGFWDARATTPTDLANLIDGPLVNDAGNPAHRFALPGNTALSMVLKRLRGDGVPRMPPLATSERDLGAEQLLADWIQTLAARQSFAQWQAAQFGSTSAPSAQPDADPDRDGRSNRLEFLTASLPAQANSGWSFGETTVAPDGSLRFTFTQPAGRAALVETTTDFATWTPWDDPDNAPSYPAADTPRTIEVAPDGTARFFRVKFSAP
jgi:mono/diheme cytochrome c family protein